MSSFMSVLVIKALVLVLKYIELHLTLFFSMFLLIPLKTFENLWFFDVFRVVKSENWEENG